MRWLVMFIVLVFAGVAYAADGRDVTASFRPSGNVLFPSVIALCDAKTSAADCGPILVPQKGGKNWIIRVYRVNETTGPADCTYDDWNVYTITDTNNTTTYEQPPIGVLDGDGTVTLTGVVGGQQIIGTGPLGPYVWVDAGTLGAGCEEFTVHLLMWN